MSVAIDFGLHVLFGSSLALPASADTITGAVVGKVSSLGTRDLLLHLISGHPIMTHGWALLTKHGSGSTWSDSQEGTDPFEEADTFRPRDPIFESLVDSTDLLSQVDKVLDSQQHSPKAQPEFPQRRKGL